MSTEFPAATSCTHHGETTLSEDQIAYFARNGFIRLQKMVSETHCTHFIERTWSRLPTTWSRNDRATWIGDVPDSCHTASLDYRRGLLKFQKGELVSDPVVDLIYGRGSNLESIAMSLTGRPFTSVRVRGLYPNVPPPGVKELRRFITPHVEAHPATIVAITYFQNVEPGCGGLLVWPGSHQKLYGAFASKLDFEATDNYKTLLRAYSELEPLELVGERGDIILTHHRLFHAPSLNRSEHIRFAFLCDYTLEGFRTLCAQEPVSLWEDWPRMREIAAVRRDAPQDHEFRLWSLADRFGKRVEADNDSTRNKRDASDLVRARHAGEVWLLASDVEIQPEDNRLNPVGGNLSNLGVQISLNSQMLKSQSFNGFIARLNPTPGQNRLTIINAKSPLWLKLIQMDSPLSNSAVIYFQRIDTLGDVVFSFRLETNFSLTQTLL